jgi:hypothetical protein
LFHAISEAGFHGQDEHDGVRGCGLEEAAVAFVAEEGGAEFLDFGPVVAPFPDDDGDGLVEEGLFDIGDIAVGGDGVGGAAHEAVDDGEAESRVDIEEADAAEGFDFEEVNEGGAMESFAEFLERDGLEFGHLEGEVQTQVEGESGGEGADEVFVAEP